MSTTTSDLRTRLQDLRTRKNDLRDERAQVARRRDDKVRAASAGSSTGDMVNSPEFQAAQHAADRLRELDNELAAVEGQEAALLSLISHANTNGNDPLDADLKGDGYRAAARALDLRSGTTRFETSGSAFLRPTMASVGVTPSSGLEHPAQRAPFVPYGRDERHIYNSFPRLDLDPDALAISDFRQSGSRTVTGSVKRDPIATTDKATLDLGVTLATDKVSQFAAVVEDCPAKLFDVEPALTAFLKDEVNYQIELALDAHAIAQINAAAPPAGAVGTGLIAQARNAVSSMRALGANPTVLAVSPATAATLDLTTAPGSGEYIFLTGTSGSASPLWAMQVVEVPNLTAPMAIDPQMTGVLYVGTGRILLDPYSSMKQNLVRIRLEVEALFHVRNILGAHVIA